MGIKWFTVNDHIKSIYKKLNVSSRAEAAVLASKQGLVWGCSSDRPTARRPVSEDPARGDGRRPPHPPPRQTSSLRRGAR